MRPSRGMGCINPDKMPGKPKIIHRKDKPQDVDVYKQGGRVKLPGLYANIHAKRKRGEKMRKPGSPGAPTNEAFKQAAKTAKR